MRGASFFTRQSRVSASLKSYYRAGLKVPFSHGWPPAYCGTAKRPGAVLSRESRSLVAPSWSPRARAPFSNHHQTAGKQSRLSRGFSMGPWPLRGSNGWPWRGLGTGARVFVRFL